MQKQQVQQTGFLVGMAEITVELHAKLIMLPEVMEVKPIIGHFVPRTVSMRALPVSSTMTAI